MGTSSPKTPTRSPSLPVSCSSSAIRTIPPDEEKTYPGITPSLPTPVSTSKSSPTMVSKSFSIESILSEKKETQKDHFDDKKSFHDHLCSIGRKEDVGRIRSAVHTNTLCHPPLSFASPYGSHSWYSSPWITSSSFLPYSGKHQPKFCPPPSFENFNLIKILCFKIIAKLDI